MQTGKYVIDCYEFTYEAIVRLDVMMDGTIKETRTVCIPDLDFDSAMEIANMIMKDAEKTCRVVKPISMIPVRKTRGTE